MRITTRPFAACSAVSCARLLKIGAAVAIVALFASACGGGSSGSKAASGSAKAGTGPAGSGSVAKGAGASLPITNDLSALNSYNWEVTLSGKGSIVAGIGLPEPSGATGPSDSVSYDIKGAYIKPDKAQMELSTGDIDLKQTVIGSQQWTSIGGVTQGPAEAPAGAVDDLQLAGFFDVGDVFRGVQGFDCGGSDKVAGVDATVCTADKADYDAMASSVAGVLDNTGVENVNDFSLKIYIAKNGGYVVKTDMTMSGKGSDNQDFSLAIHLNVSDLNNVAEIKP